MKHTLLPILACLMALTAQAQENNLVKEKDPSVAVAFSLMPFSYNTAEIDVDLRLKERQWLTIAPRVQYADNAGYVYDAMDAIKSGVGLGLTYRYFPLTRKSHKHTDGCGPYISGSLRGQTTLYKYKGNSYVNFTDDYGIDGFYVVGDKSYLERTSQLSVDICLGYSLRLFDVLFADAFIGLGSRFSDYAYDERKGFDLGENSWDTGFTGYTLTGGFRLGIFLDKYTR